METNNAPQQKRVFNLVIIDASGSMSSIYQQALSGLNETIQTIRMAQVDHPEMQQYLTLASFSSGNGYLNHIYTTSPITQVKELTEKDYRVGGCTALYDAMGEMITDMQQRIRHDDYVLVTVITDGYENASSRWNSESLRSLVGELEQMGWTFTYIGANQDVYEVSKSIGIKHCMSYATDPDDTKAMFAKERKSRSKFFGMMADCLGSGARFSLKEDYFGDV